jgi:hypothetical protein
MLVSTRFSLSILNPPTPKYNPALEKATRESESPSRLSVQTGQSSPGEQPTSSQTPLSGAETDSWNSGDVSGNRKDTIKCLTLERGKEENLSNAV